MTLEDLRDKIRSWDLEVSSEGVATAQYGKILNELEHLSLREWGSYLPAEHPDNVPNFLERLAGWVGNVAENEDQKLMLEYALQISFFSHNDFTALYQTAFNRIVSGWLLEKSCLSLGSNMDGFQSRIDELLYKKTWYCPVTDSMDVNEFYKVNYLQGIGHRPAFFSLQYIVENQERSGDQVADVWIRYMANPDSDPSNSQSPALEYIVLLEDFVGSGTQCADAVRWAAENLQKPVLFIPLIICPKGVDNLRKLESEFNGRLTVRPVIELAKGDLLGPERESYSNWSKSSEMEVLIERSSARAHFFYAPFGYNDTGCSVVMFSNTPDNSVSLIHDTGQQKNWNPLFPRVYRDS